MTEEQAKNFDIKFAATFAGLIMTVGFGMFLKGLADNQVFMAGGGGIIILLGWEFYIFRRNKIREWGNKSPKNQIKQFPTQNQTNYLMSILAGYIGAIFSISFYFLLPDISSIPSEQKFLWSLTFGFIGLFFFFIFYKISGINASPMENNSKKTKERISKSYELTTVFTGILTFATVLLAVFTFQLFQSNQKLVELEEKSNSPFLSVWQKEEINISNYDLVDQRKSSHNFWGICLRNDGRTSTGRVWVLPIENNFTFYNKSEHPYVYFDVFFENIPSGEGNCIPLEFWYKPCLEQIDCNQSNVPLGIQKIPIQVKCDLCDPKGINSITEIQFCVKPSDECK